MPESMLAFNLKKCKEDYNAMKAAKPVAYAKLSEKLLNKPVVFAYENSIDIYGRVVAIDKNTFKLTVKCWTLRIDNPLEGTIKLAEDYFYISPKLVTIVEEKDLTEYYTTLFEQILLAMFQNAVIVHGGFFPYTISNLDMSDVSDVNSYINAQSNFINSANAFMRKSIKSYVNKTLLLKNNDVMLCSDYVVTDEAGKGLEGYKISFTGDAATNIVKYVVAKNTTQFSIDDVAEKSFKIGLDCFDENINTVIDNWLNIISPKVSGDEEVHQEESPDSNK